MRALWSFSFCSWEAKLTTRVLISCSGFPEASYLWMNEPFLTVLLLLGGLLQWSFIKQGVWGSDSEASGDPWDASWGHRGLAPSRGTWGHEVPSVAFDPWNRASGCALWVFLGFYNFECLFIWKTSGTGNSSLPHTQGLEFYEEGVLQWSCSVSRGASHPMFMLLLLNLRKNWVRWYQFSRLRIPLISQSLKAPYSSSVIRSTSHPLSLILPQAYRPSPYMLFLFYNFIDYIIL